MAIATDVPQWTGSKPVADELYQSAWFRQSTGPVPPIDMKLGRCWVAVKRATTLEVETLIGLDRTFKA